VSSTNLPLTQDQPVSADPASSSAGSASGVLSTMPTPASDQAAAGSPDVPAMPTEPDELAAAAVELARQAAEETAEPNTVGEHLGVTVDEGGLTMHSFGCTSRGYRGWRWAVTLAHVPGSDRVTVCDVVLLPGADSILAPAWVPWSDRLAPGDLGAGDDLPYRADDPLLVPGYTITDPDDADQALFWELGLGRERVVGLEGLQAAADRWEHGPHGPTSETAIQASASCLSCAYFLPVSGFLRQHFGACTNEWSPADGTVVTTDFGCGAHSETDLELPASEPLPPHILDEMIIEHVIVDRHQPGSAEPSAETSEPEGGSAEPSAQLEPALEILDAVGLETPEPIAELIAEAAPEAILEPEPEPDDVDPEAQSGPAVRDEAPPAP
jgi:Protein of unknown function (DUF3027)